jgi:hypothetical protein
MVVYSGKVLKTIGPADDDNLEQTPLFGHLDQQFIIDPVPGTCYFRIKNKASDKCLEVSLGSFGLLANIAQFTCSGATHQQWKLIPTF